MTATKRRRRATRERGCMYLLYLFSRACRRERTPTARIDTVVHRYRVLVPCKRRFGVFSSQRVDDVVQ